MRLHCVMIAPSPHKRLTGAQMTPYTPNKAPMPKEVPEWSLVPMEKAAFSEKLDRAGFSSKQNDPTQEQK